MSNEINGIQINLDLEKMSEKRKAPLTVFMEICEKLKGFEDIESIDLKHFDE